MLNKLKTKIKKSFHKTKQEKKRDPSERWICPKCHTTSLFEVLPLHTGRKPFYKCEFCRHIVLYDELQENQNENQKKNNQTKKKGGEKQA